MKRKKSGLVLSHVVAVVIAVVGAVGPAHSRTWAQSQEGGQPAIAKRIGTVKAVNGNTITLAVSGSPDVAVTVLPNARLLRLAPGEKDLKNATPLQLTDLQVGDTIRARGQGSTDGNSIAALEIVVITSSALSAVRDQIRQDWQKRGTGGLVKTVDAAGGTVTISVTGNGGAKTIAVHTTSKTVLRRYAPDSVKFDDAKPSSLQEIHPGDQLRARGERSADGLEMTAEEIVTGSFRNVAGTVNSVDASAGTVNVQDVLSKKSVVLKIAAESELHQLPAEMAQRIAMRLKGGASSGAPGAGQGPSGGANGQPAAPSGGAGANGGAPNGKAWGGGPGGGTGSGMRPGGSGDFQQILNRMPAVTLTDLHKGDAVMIVATEGSAAGSTVITLLSGVEPILQAAPSASQAMMLTPWSLGAPGGEGMQ